MSTLSIVLSIILLQVIVGLIIICILKNILDGILIENAFKKCEIIKAEEIKDLVKIEVTVHKKLKEDHIRQIQRIFYRKLRKEIPMDLHISPKIRGGVIIKAGEKIVDYSLASRLKKSGLFRS